MLRRLVKYIVLSLLIAFQGSAFALELQQEPEVVRYLQALETRYHFDGDYLRDLFSQVTFNPKILEKMEPPPAKPSKVVQADSSGSYYPSWYYYRKMFTNPERIQAGVVFWKKYHTALRKAEKEYGVPAEVIAGIIGVETSYGTDKGNYSAINTLTTLAFKYPRRASYFRDELTAYLILCREQGWDPLMVKGSWAGALGLPQFMPSSYREYAVSAHKNGSRDLFYDYENVIASVGNYLNKKGWKAHQPVAISAKTTTEGAKHLANKAKLQYTVKELKKQGLLAEGHVNKKLSAGVLMLKNIHSIDPWITFENFAVIKRYNSNNHYAMAVYELGNIIKQKARKS